LIWSGAQRLNPRSLRYRALLAVVAVLVLPIGWVWASGVTEGSGLQAQRDTLDRAVRAVAAGADPATLAEADRLRVRVVSGGRVVRDEDWSDLRGIQDLGDPLWGPEGPPRVAAVDAALGPLADRPEVRQAGPEPAPRCVLAAGDRLLLCTAAMRTASGDVVHASVGSRRLVRSLYEDRFQLAALTSVVLAIGITMALWIGWRMVRPIESLRDQVVARAGGRLSTEPVVLDRDDELGELATAFNGLLSALEQRNRSNAAFVGDLAHELKNPVAAVRAAAEALEGDRPVDARRRERLQRVLADASARMEAVVDRFLDLARAEAGLLDARRERVPLTALARALVVPYRDDPRFVGVRFEVHGDDHAVDGVPERLETALRNVLHNAASYAGPNGLVVVSVTAVDGWLTLRIRDSGPGIPPEDLPRVFDRYFSTREGGTGIGLALTKAIVEAHGGKVAVSSPGGAEVALSLPAA
jgi:signal transduction histidine kinase